MVQESNHTDSELLSLARDNSVQLTATQRAFACTSLQRDAKELECVNTQIEVLTTQRDVLKSNVDSYTSLLSPIRLLPREILGEIFFHTLGPSEGPHPVSVTGEAPLLLCLVCKWWQSISYDTPTLWARLHFVNPSHAPKRYPFERRKHILEQWLGRSGGLPLSISITEATSQSSIDVEDHRDLAVSILRPIAARWEELSLTYPSVKTIRDLAKFDAPLLKCLDITLGTLQRSQGGYYEVLCQFLSPKQMLKKLNIPIITNLDPLRLPIQWENLTDLAVQLLADTPTSQILQMLQTMSQLQTLALNLSYSEPSENIPTIDMPCLQTLRVVDRARLARHQPAQSHGLLHQLYVPNLRKLLYHQNVSLCYLEVTEASSDMLESINVAFPVHLHNHLVEFFRSVPTLKHLRLLEDHRNARVREEANSQRTIATVIFNSLAGVCPHLETLHFCQTLPDPTLSVVDLAAYTSFVAERPSLKLIDIRFSEAVPVEMEEGLLELQAEWKKTLPNLVFQLNFMPKLFDDNPKSGIEPLEYDRYQLD